MKLVKPAQSHRFITWTVFLVAAANEDSEMFLEDWNNIPPLVKDTRFNITNNPGTIIIPHYIFTIK